MVVFFAVSVLFDLYVNIVLFFMIYCLWQYLTLSKVLKQFLKKTLFGQDYMSV